MSVLVAAALDATVSEPRPAAHPVVWAGRYLDATARAVPAQPPVRAVVSGGLAWLVGAGTAVAVAVLFERLARRAGPVGGAVVRGVALWPLLSARMLLAEVAAVEAAVSRDLDAGRRALSRIVGRDTAGLEAAEVRAAAIESLAENLSDSVVAPLAWYAVGGLPGAALHRFANTADACWGYRTDRWRYAGRVAARADDLLNLVPARISALLLGPAGGRRLVREARRTDSPNAGWPMAAVALRLDLALAKSGHYSLNDGGRPPTAADVADALRLARRAIVSAFAAATVADHLFRLPSGGRP